MGNNLNRKSTSTFNCFNSKATNRRRQMKQSFSYDSASRHNFLSKMKNSFKSGPFSSHGRVPKSNTDQNFLVIDEPLTDANLNQIDELYTHEKDDYIDEIERQFGERPAARFQKSPAIYNIQSIENDDVKISDLMSNSTSYSFDRDNCCSDRTSRSSSSLTVHSDCSADKRKRFSPSLIKKLILKSLNNRPSCKSGDGECAVLAFSGVHGNQETLKFIDDSVSCVLRQSSSSIESLSKSPSMSKSHTNLDASPQNSFFSFKILNDVNRKLNKIQHLKKKKSVRCSAGREQLCNDQQVYLNELNTIKLDFADNISVYTLFNTLDKRAPFASSENTTISTSVDLLDSRDYFFHNSFSSLSLLNS